MADEKQLNDAAAQVKKYVDPFNPVKIELGGFTQKEIQVSNSRCEVCGYNPCVCADFTGA